MATDLVTQRQTGEMVGIRRIKGQSPRLYQIESPQWGRLPPRVGQSVLYGQSHICLAQMGHYRTIGEFDHRMHNRLAVNDHVNLFDSNAKKAAGLNYFKALIH